MGKYIIELDEDPHNIRLMQLKNGGDGVPVTEFKVVCPYKEPDLEKAEADGYAKGYQHGYDSAEYDAEQTRRDAYKEGYKDGKAASNSNPGQEIKIGDEAIFSDGKKGYIIEIDGHVYKAFNEDFEIGTWSKFGFTLTGKNIPEIAIVLQKIKGE